MESMDLAYKLLFKAFPLRVSYGMGNGKNSIEMILSVSSRQSCSLINHAKRRNFRALEAQ